MLWPPQLQRKRPVQQFREPNAAKPDYFVLNEYVMPPNMLKPNTSY